ncbi:restriction endonuclease subunit S [Hydrogenimonas thermophila]|uniref:Type I restriction enzyme, S subunit n=1 Tax=Hydrogenimonas thermophila TaxID=223786 RepID=A0A1I5TUV0_9BACT|nr:restriction endonuclease subunit S [Hydrogenimonas thermophila]SFP86377.1 type I restriction enzyme, S subunit [Hydrogenimonas thermophila]
MKKLPEGWREVRLEEICEVNMGQSPKSETYNENNIGLPLIQGNADIKNRKTLPRVYTSEPTKQCDIGDIIMTVRAPVGAIAKSYHNACIGRGVCALKPKENNDFLYHFLVNYEDKWDKLSQGSTFTAVNGNDIKNIKILYPPLEEQKKIAEILSTVDQKIDFVDKQIEETETLKKGLMQKLLTQGIGHSEFKDSEIGRIPKSWEVSKLENHVKIISGQSPSKFIFDGGRYKFFKVNQLNFCEKYLSESEYSYNTSNYENLKVGTIIFPKRGAAIFTNKVRILKTEGFIDTNLMGLITKKTLNSEFLYYLLVMFELSNIADTSSIPQINNKHINPLKFPFPPIEEQKQIAEILSTVDQKIENLKAKKEAFEELKKGLMQKLLTGEVRVKV